MNNLLNWLEKNSTVINELLSHTTPSNEAETTSVIVGQRKPSLFF